MERDLVSFIQYISEFFLVKLLRDNAESLITLYHDRIFLFYVNFQYNHIYSLCLLSVQKMIYDARYAFYNNFCGWIIGKNAYTVLYWIYWFWHQSTSTLHRGICINWAVQGKLGCSSQNGSVCIPDFTPLHRSTEVFSLFLEWCPVMLILKLSKNFSGIWYPVSYSSIVLLWIPK